MQHCFIRRTLAFSAIICGLLLLNYHTPIFGADAPLSWTPNSESDLAGYKVYYGTASGNYGPPINVANQTTHTVTGLNAGTYYFAVTAFDTSGNESGLSNEVSKVVSADPPPPPPPPPPPGSTITLVDFGATSAGTTFGLSGWSTVIKDVYTDYQALGPGGTTIVVGDNYTYNFQGVRGNARSFASGEKIRVTWYNNSATPISFTPNISFTDPDRIISGATGIWYGMTPVTVPSSGTAISEYTFDSASAGFYSLVNVNSNNSSSVNYRVVVADKLELIAAGISPPPPSAACADTLDNDQDGLIDLADPGCTNPEDNDEFNAPPTPAPTVTLTANPINIQAGQSSTLTWSSTNANSVSINQGIGTVATSGTLSVSPSISTVYTATALGPGGNATASASITVTAPSLKFTQISLSKVSNTSVRINWSTDKAATGLIEYGTNSVGELSKLESTLATQHRTDLVGLTPSTVYLYGITATDASNNQAATGVLRFKTANKPGRSATPSSDATFISQVTESSDFRTNLGVNNLSTSTANVSATLVDVDGMELATKTLQVEPQGLTQINSVAPYLYDENLGNEIRGNLYLESDQPISAWASQIENSTNDPSLLLSKRSGATQILIPSAANTGAFTSSLVLMNVGVTTGNVAIKAYGVDGTVLGQTATPLSIPANGILAFDNILETLGVSGNYGPLEITSLDNVPLVAASRVSSTSRAGGFFEGIRYSDASLLQFIPHVVDTAELRTNLGINNVSDTLASVMVRLMSPQGTELGAMPVMVLPRGMTQLNHVVRQLLNRGEVTNVEGYLRLESSQPILAWASQIDNATNDPGFAVSKGVGAIKLLVQSTANVGNFKSSLVVVNLGTAAAAVDIVAHSIQGTVQGELRGQMIPPGGFVSFANILERLGAFNSFGPVEIISTNGQPLLATSRVYSLSGTSGFFEAQALE